MYKFLNLDNNRVDDAGILVDCNWPLLKDLAIEYSIYSLKQSHFIHWIVKLMVRTLYELGIFVLMREIND